MSKKFGKMDARKLLPKILFNLLLIVFGSNSASGQITRTLNAIGEQPLSQIAIEKAVIALHDQASINAYPLVLGVENQCVNSGKSHYSGTVNGTIHVVVGGAGSHLSGFSQVTPTWSLYRDYDFGFVKLTAFNHSSLLFEYKKSRDGNVYDSFTILPRCSCMRT